jgi:hypothetical protein
MVLPPSTGPKSGYHFWDQADAHSLERHIVQCGKPGPVFQHDVLKVLEHFSAKWLRFAVKKCGKPRKRDDSTPVETV